MPFVFFFHFEIKIKKLGIKITIRYISTYELSLNKKAISLYLSFLHATKQKVKISSLQQQQQQRKKKLKKKFKSLLPSKNVNILLNESNYTLK